MRRLVLPVAVLLSAVALSGCPKAPPSTGPGSAAAASPTPAVDPAKQNDQELFRSAMLSRDPKERARLLEILLARQDDADARQFVEKQLVQTYAELGDIEKMEKIFSDLTLEDDLDGAQVRNAVAYAWAEKGIKLDTAQQYILSSLNILDRMENTHRGMPPDVMDDEAAFSARIEETRGYFLDTLGWIDHKQGKDKEAVAVLEEAARRSPHGTIQYHLGEAYSALGDVPTAAKAYAAAAVEDDDDSPKAKAALDAMKSAGKIDPAPLLAEAKKAHDARVAKEKADAEAEEKARAARIAEIAQQQREGAKRGALDFRLDVVAPDFSIADFAGKSLANPDLQHHVTILDFWASWCGPCRMEMPHVEKLFQKYKDKVRFLAISLDDKKDDATGFLKDESYTFPVAFDDQGEVGRAFQITGLPTLVVIGPCGKVAWVHRGFNPNIETVLTEQIEKLLSEKNQKCEASK